MGSWSNWILSDCPLVWAAWETAALSLFTALLKRLIKSGCDLNLWERSTDSHSTLSAHLNRWANETRELSSFTWKHTTTLYKLWLNYFITTLFHCGPSKQSFVAGVFPKLLYRWNVTLKLSWLIGSETSATFLWFFGRICRAETTGLKRTSRELSHCAIHTKVQVWWTLTFGFV